MSTRPTRTESPAAAAWMPTFCSTPTLFVLMIVGELVALVIVLAPQDSPREWLPRLATTSVYVQWLVLLPQRAFRFCLRKKISTSRKNL